jgi:hypothetical protein
MTWWNVVANRVLYRIAWRHHRQFSPPAASRKVFVEQTISIPTPAAPDFSIYDLVMHSHPVVKGVLVLLVLASVACWAIIIQKVIPLALELSSERRSNRHDAKRPNIIFFYQ